MKINCPAVLLWLLLPLAAVAARKDHDFRARPDDWFRSGDGGRIVRNVLSWQSQEGSWPKNVDTFSAPYTGEKQKLQGTFDNGATTDELRFLSRAAAVTGDSACKAACERGVQHILAAQYPTGGWPQYSPPPKNKYHRYITFNDDAMVRLLEFLREVGTNEVWSFLQPTTRDAAKKAFDRGVDCILRCQIQSNGKLTGWCAQHDELTLEPRPARAFELAAASGAESVGIARLLMSLPHPTPQVIRAVDSAVAWLDSVKLPGIKVVEIDAPGTEKGTDRVVVKDARAKPMWARFYELETNKPIYCGRDGVKKYNFAEIEYERRNGYAWLGYWPESLLGKEYAAWKKRVGR